MAVAFASISAAAFTNGTGSFTVTKPTGLAAGDLLILINGDNGGGDQLTPPSGWTEVFYVAQASNRASQMMCKVADSTDAAATNFTFTYGGGGVHGGALIRVTGTSFSGLSNFVVNGAYDGGAFTHTYTSSIIAQAVGSLYIIQAIAGDDQAQGGYAIASNNPTWTERIDSGSNLGNDMQISAATATSTAAASTGNITVTSAADTYSVGMIIVSIVESASGPANLKSYDGNTKANIKSMNGNSLANIKSVNGNT